MLQQQERSLDRAKRSKNEAKISDHQNKVDSTKKDIDSIIKRREEIAQEIRNVEREVLNSDMSFSYKDVFRAPTTRTTIGRKTAYNILASSGSMLISPTTFNTVERMTKYKVSPNKYLKDGSRMRNKTSLLTAMHPVNEIIYVAR